MHVGGVDNDESQSGGSLVLTDSRCNLHLTSSECFERAVRLPAALKAAKEAKGNIQITTTVEDRYLELAQKKVIFRAHKASYIQRIKTRCLSATESHVVPLTEDSEGQGGEDTSKYFCFHYSVMVHECHD
jgi:acetoin utilization deacetylase AcuC-like enzyme